MMNKAINFQRCTSNPIIPRTPYTFYSIHTANPDFLHFKDKYFLYFRGQDDNCFDQISVVFSEPEKFNGTDWKIFPENPIVRVGHNPKDFDSGYILDPATIIINDKIYLYYTAHRRDWNDWDIPSHVGLAISEDGFHFEKSEQNPIIYGVAPEIVFFEDNYFLFFQRKNTSGFFEIFCCPSKDGIYFSEENVKKVFGPSNEKGNFDQFSISTVRIWQEENWFYMFYGGADKYFDYPVAIGLARSQDLLNWVRYPQNPILQRGEPGTWDEGALWFASVQKINETYYLWYEGVGTGLELNDPNAKRASKICREGDYGGYKKTAFSQIGLATFNGNLTNWE